MLNYRQGESQCGEYQDLGQDDTTQTMQLPLLFFEQPCGQVT